MSIRLPVPLSLYVHIPWCVKKCPYCDFNSHQVNGDIPEAEYIAALCRDFLLDIQYFLSQRSLSPLQSIFFGGGTPSLFHPASYKTFLQTVRKHLVFAPAIEITMEANPGAVDAKYFADFFDIGINRLSIGVQSFNARQLSRLGRIHQTQDVFNAFHAARKSGFQNINLDLMFGLPEQTPDQAMADLEEAIRLQPEHISWYQLTIEPNTHFFRHPPQLPEEEAIWQTHQAGIEKLAAAGYHQYEVSAFSQAGFQAKHNLNYWTFGDYLGLGAGAHGKITNDQGEILRYWKTRLPKHYLTRLEHFRAGHESLSKQDLPFEFLMNALRLKQGVAEQLFQDRTGLTLNDLEPQLTGQRKKGLIQPKRLQCSDFGYLHLNSVLADFTEN